jgi:hypothetical protein
MEKEIEWLEWLEKTIQEEIDFNIEKTSVFKDRFVNGVIEGLAMARNRVEVAIHNQKRTMRILRRNVKE